MFNDMNPLMELAGGTIEFIETIPVAPNTTITRTIDTSKKYIIYSTWRYTWDVLRNYTAQIVDGVLTVLNDVATTPNITVSFSGDTLTYTNNHTSVYMQVGIVKVG